MIAPSIEFAAPVLFPCCFWMIAYDVVVRFVQKRRAQKQFLSQWGTGDREVRVEALVKYMAFTMASNDNYLTSFSRESEVPGRGSRDKETDSGCQN